MNNIKYKVTKWVNPFSCHIISDKTLGPARGGGAIE